MGLGKRRIADRGKVIKFNPIPIATVVATISKIVVTWILATTTIFK